MDLVSIAWTAALVGTLTAGGAIWLWLVLNKEEK